MVMQKIIGILIIHFGYLLEQSSHQSIISVPDSVYGVVPVNDPGIEITGTEFLIL